MKWLLLILFAVPCLAHATDEARIERRLARANAGISRDWLAADAIALQSRYVDDAVLMPEHATARRGAPAIGAYYAALFKAARVTDYHRMSQNILEYDGHAVQTGTYRLVLAVATSPGREFRGKFMALWDLRTDTPRLVCELWGADSPFERTALPAIDLPSSPRASPDAPDPSLAAEVAARNALIGQLVTERRGSDHAALFLPDAIYLPYYSPMRIGITQIRDYFLAHEQPGEVAIEALHLERGAIRPLQGHDVVLEEGFYRVAWRAGNDHGVVRGKSLNLWQRDAQGELKLLRQAVNHD